MSPLSQLQAIAQNKYLDEDDREFGIELLEPLSKEQINAFAQQCPTQSIPADIRELLGYASGFLFPPLDQIAFDCVNQFGMDQIFPCSIQLAGDGFGNFWILDISPDGNWGSVFYACHDPAVIVLHSTDLTQFVRHVDEFGKDKTNAHLNIIHEKTAFSIWQNDNGFIEYNAACSSSDNILKEFASSFPSNYVFADLRDKPLSSGFAWGKFLSSIEKTVRHSSELLWAFEKSSKKNFFQKLFSKSLV